MWLENWPLSCKSTLRFSPWCGQKTGPLNSVVISSLVFWSCSWFPDQKGGVAKRLAPMFLQDKRFAEGHDSLITPREREWPTDCPPPLSKREWPTDWPPPLEQKGVANRLAPPPEQKGVANRLAPPPPSKREAFPALSSHLFTHVATFRRFSPPSLYFADRSTVKIFFGARTWPSGKVRKGGGVGSTPEGALPKVWRKRILKDLVVFYSSRSVSRSLVFFAW